MNIYVMKNGERIGPCSLTEVREALAADRMSYNDPAWHEGAADWMPLHTVPGVMEPDAGLHQIITEGPQVRPWIRYWARSTDTMLTALSVGGIIGTLSVFAPISLPEGRGADAVFGAVILLVMIPVEALMLSLFGTTPGKWLFRIRVTTKGGKLLTYPQALRRSADVWLRGMGTGLIPLITLITSINAYRKLSSEGATSWDRAGNYTVSHRLIGIPGGIAAILLLTAIVAVSLFGTLAGDKLDSMLPAEDPTEVPAK